MPRQRRHDDQRSHLVAAEVTRRLPHQRSRRPIDLNLDPDVIDEEVNTLTDGQPNLTAQ